MGFFEFHDDIFLVVPKSVRIYEYSRDSINNLVLKYAKFFDLYTKEVHSARKYIKSDCSVSLKEWISNEKKILFFLSCFKNCCLF